MKQQIFLNQSSRKYFLIIALLLMSATSVALTQTAEFTYQGKLSDNGNPANGNYDLQVKLYDAPTAGTQIGVRARTDVLVTNGNFAVQLDFAPAAFNGLDRFLEIAIKPAGSPNPFTTLSPRQPITSSPYAFHSLSSDVADAATTATDSTQLGGVVANQYVVTTDTRLSDARQPLSGSTDYLQNRTTPSQPSTNFNISGNGIIGGNLIVSGTLSANLPSGDSSYIQNRLTQQANTNFNVSGNGTLGGTLSATGAINTITQYNIGNSRVLSIGGADSVFVGLGAGTNDNGTSNRNSFFGHNAGNTNTISTNNSFFGYQAGQNSVGENFTGDNSFFGSHVGEANTTGTGNSFFGIFTGRANTTGEQNSFFGYAVGEENTRGFRDSFFGVQAGQLNTTGDLNSFFGWGAGFQNTTGNWNTAVGAGADFGSDNLTYATAIGADARVESSNTIVLGRSDGSDFVRIPGLLTIPNLASAGMTQLCRNSFDRIGDCSSSLRYKTNLAPYLTGISIVNQLRPISFTWKEGGMRDLGFGAEDVEKIDPLLVTYNKQGQVEGVKYDRISVVLVNAIKEQQQQITAQQKQIQQSRSIKAENAELKTQVAALNARLERVEKRLARHQEK